MSADVIEPTKDDDVVDVTDAELQAERPDGDAAAAPLAASLPGGPEGPAGGAGAEGPDAGEKGRDAKAFARSVASSWRTFLLERRRKRGGVSNKSTWLLLAGLLVLFGATAASLQYLQPADQGTELNLTELSKQIEAGRVTEATFLDEDARIVGTYRGFVGDGSGERVDIEFFAPYPSSDSATGPLIRDLTEAGAVVTVDPQPTKGTVRLVATVLLPLMILANLFALLFVGSRDSGGALGELTNFASVGDGRGKKAKGPRPVTFDDVAGAGDAVVELREVVDYLTHPEKYAELGAAPPKGVLLFGPPGCGKTLLAKAVAGEAGVPFFNVAGAEFVEQLVGVGAARVRDLFARVRAAAPAIVFIDEIDAAGRKRGSGDSSGGTDEREQTLNQLLVEMDGFEAATGIVVIGATNRPDILDPALLRPGRFDRHVTVEKPDPKGREAILALHARNKALAADIEWADIAKKTPGYTGADLANVVNEAALLTIRQGRRTIERREMIEAIDRVKGGTQRGKLLSESEKERIAVHEAGHAVVVASVSGADKLDRVTIFARGGSLGSARMLDGDDAALFTETQLHARMTQALAGSAAELLKFGEASTGTEGDLESATSIALDIAARYGMSEELGPVRLLAHDSDGFLGGTQKLGDLSPELHKALDDEVRRLTEEARDRAWAILEANVDVVDLLTEALLEAEHVEGAKLRDLLDQVTPEADLA